MSSAFGYPDWQRVQSRDGEPLLDRLNLACVGTQIAGAFNVSRWQRLMGLIAVGGSAVLVQIEWWLDSALTKQVGQKSLVLHPSIALPPRLALSNQGPWVTLTFIPEHPATNWTFTGWLFGADRDPPLPVEPVEAQVISRDLVTVPAMSTSVFWPRTYYAGPALVWTNFAADGLFWRLWSMSDALTSNRVMLRNPAANVNDVEVVLAPVGAWFIDITNPNAFDVVCNLAVTPSETGG